MERLADVPAHPRVAAMIRQLTGDCREVLRTLPANSCHVAITSPPYWGLRDYGTEPVVWGGILTHAHQWGLEVGPPHHPGQVPQTIAPGTTVAAGQTAGSGRFCPCGAWLGSLGLEPTPELFVQHMVEVFREVHRVLRDDGSLWLNLGDSYAGSGKGPTGHNGIGDQERRQGFNGGLRNTTAAKPKDLMEIPSDVVRALRQDGWYLRSRIPWLKRNSMPESVTDRPATAVEYVFLLAKSGTLQFWVHRDGYGSRTQPAPDYRWIDAANDGAETDIEPPNWRTERLHGVVEEEEIISDDGDVLVKRPVLRWKRINLWSGRDYYWDADAVRVAASENTHSRGSGTGKKNGTIAFGQGIKNNEDYTSRINGYVSARSRRNSDWFFESWQGLLLDEDDGPLALVVNPAGFREAHFATFPTKLVEPMVKASTSERGVCAACGAPWARVVQTRGGSIGKSWHDHQDDLSVGHRDDVRTDLAWRNGDYQRTTTGWQPTCACSAGEPVPAAVLDPFGGSGTVGLVADRLGRSAVLIDLKPTYVEMQERRLMNDAPLFVELESA